ncbi:MAG: Lpg1974 family pore-forming outer membrane protein [Bythopirellula sp.]
MGGFLYLHTTDADVTYAQQQDGIGGAGTVPRGRIGSLGPHHEPGFRVGATWACSDCASIVGTYSFFESDSIDALQPPNFAGGATRSLVNHPGASITASNGPLTAAYDVDFQLADIAYRSIWKANDCYAINWSVGARYGSLTQDFRQLGDYAPPVTGVIETRSNVDFDGGGLRLGLDFERRMGCSGFSVYSSGFVSPMSGRFHADYLLYNNTGAIELARADWQDDRVVTALDLEAGVAWTGRCRRFRASAGYLSSYWFNTLTTMEFINAVQANSYDNASDTLHFEGLTASLEWRW